MVIYGLKNCDTCRKAAKEISAAGRAVDLVDVRDAPLSDAQLNRFLTDLGPGLVNTRSTTWRSLSDTERMATPFDLLRAHPALMKRPVVEDDGQLYLGWTPPIKAALLG